MIRETIATGAGFIAIAFAFISAYLATNNPMGSALSLGGAFCMTIAFFLISEKTTLKEHP
jgi:lipopolysaccharide export LptBFGC system permease protein LptF